MLLENETTLAHLKSLYLRALSVSHSSSFTHSKSTLIAAENVQDALVFVFMYVCGLWIVEFTGHNIIIFFLLHFAAPHRNYAKMLFQEC